MKEKQYNSAVNWNWIIISTAVVSALTVLVLYMPNLTEYDANVLHSVRLAFAPYPVCIPTFFGEFGRANYMLWPQIAAGSVLVSQKRYAHAVMLIAFTQASFFLKDILKDFVCRERPCDYPGFSFPSGHTCTTTCFCGILIYLALTYAKTDFWKYFLTGFFSLYIIFTGISRLWLGVHYPVDVIAGLFLGLLLVNIYILISKTFIKN